MNKSGIRLRSWLTLFVFLLLVQGKVFGQLVADFSATPVSGCSPIVVQFTDHSTGNPVQWRWDLGNGVISYLQNPSSSYFNAGTYNISLVVSNPGGADSIVKNQFITVYANPAVDFSASDSTGCFPLPVQFTDLSIAGSGSITSRNWDFGDGTISTLQNPSHVYTTAGSFSVTLNIINSNGCTKTISKTQYIRTTDGVTAGFTNNTPGNCAAPITINFANTSTGPGVLTYTWDFGDGATSTFTNPVHTYTNPGTYTVSLVAVSPQGCLDTIRKVNLISIGTISSQFTSPASVCQQQSFTITNTSAPAPGTVLWSFGDGTTSTQINPIKTYSSSGTFIIKLVNNFGGCQDSVSHSINVIPKPAAAFTANQTVFCQVPVVANFINQSIGGTTFLWNFGDGGSSTATTPSYTYTVAGNYTVTLIATNASGCTDTLIKVAYIKIQKPVIVISGFPQAGCIPLTIAPTATVTANEPIASYLWNFGDGTTSNLINPSHSYTVAGTYILSLTITTVGGCTQTLVIPNAVKAGNKPHAAFTANPTDVCAFTTVNFVDQSTGSGDQWLWNFGDGNTSTSHNATHAYTDTGYFNITLVVWSNGCADTLRIPNMIHVRPPVAVFSTNNNCIDKFRKDFTDQSIGPVTWLWDFGDGTTSVVQNPSHTYSLAGTYSVSLMVTNGSCSHSVAHPVRVIVETANFSADLTELCSGNAINLAAININAANISTWLWNFGDSSTATTPSAASHIYIKRGTFTVSLTIKDLLGCVSVKTITVTVFGPTAAFTFNTPGACLGQSNILFTDASTTDGTHAITKWVWNYGDGVIDSTSPPPYNHLYTAAGVYDVSLTVTDNFGCSSSMLKPAAITIAQPHAAFNSPDTNSCTDKPVHFNNTSVGYDLLYNWQFGDGSTGTVTNPVHSYSSIGVYSVNLLVTDRYGCKDSVNKPGYIKISYPRASFTMSDSLGMCPPLLVDFTNFSSDYTSLAWNFGDGNTSSLPNPSHYYTVPGIYYAKLLITGPGGCMDSLTKKIELRGPAGYFDYIPVTGCEPMNVTFKAVTSNRVLFLWDFSDGTTLATTDSIVTHLYSLPGEYVPKMIISDASGCTVPVFGHDTIRVVSVTAVFSTAQFKFCDSGYVNFYDHSYANDLITTYQWSFGDGSFSNVQNPSHHYVSPGAYDIQLIIITQAGCTDSVSLNDSVTIFESPVINIVGDSSACAPALLTFAGQLNNGNVVEWKWDFNNGQIATIQNPPAQLFSNAGPYTITLAATDGNGCKDSVVKAVNIYPVPVVSAGPDGFVCRDNFIQLHATGAATYTWDASPSLSCTDCADPLAAPADSTMYVVAGASSFGCTQKDSVIITVRQHFILSVSAGDSLCAGGFVRLSASGASQYSWSPAAGLDNTTTATPAASPVQTTTYTVIASDDDNCFSDTATVLVEVFPVPTVEAGPDITVAVGSSGQIHATGSADVSIWKWTPAYNLSCSNCPDPVVNPKQTTKYLLEVVNSGGCRGQDDITVFVVCKNANLFIPNTFSPNGDGANERFYPRGTGLFLIKAFRVYNRWGEIVFQRMDFSANDAASGWDGTYKGQKLSTDVYVYSCDVMCENNELLSFKGDVTLLR